MNHNDIRHKLSEYLDNALSADERAAVETHLKSCQTCTDALIELRRTVEQVKQVEEIEPPAWMMQKIMAQVRAEAEVKKSWYQRFFFPLAVKLPIQAVVVLFLAVTAYYVQQNINPVEQYTEPPATTYDGAKPATSLPAPAPEPKIQRESAAPAKKVPQTPEYKALDMKLAYERPALPKPRDKAETPASEKVTEQPMNAQEDYTAGKVEAPQRSGAPDMMKEQATGEPSYLEARPQSATKQKRAPAMTDETGGDITVQEKAGQFHLRINQEAIMESDNLKLMFLKVTEDSRCPTGAQCIWEGQVTIVLTVMSRNQNRGDISLTRRAGNHEDLAVKSVDGYTVKLLQVEPYPSRDQQIKSTDYIITLVISKI